MNPKSAEFNRIECEASEWLETMSQRLVSLDQRARFDAWLKSDLEHARAYERQKEILQLAGTFPDLLEEGYAEDAAGALEERRRLKYATIAATVLLVVGALVFASRHFSWPGSAETYETTTAQVKDIELEDGTLVTLGAASQMTVAFGDHARRVELMRGEAFFEVTRDTNRPFVVAAGDTTVRVLGTKFDVHYGPQAVRVAVLEGRVEVRKGSDGQKLAVAAKPSKAQVLNAGEAAIATQVGGISTAGNLSKEDLGAWRQGRLVYVDTRLRDIVSDLNRYYDGKIEFVDESVGDLRLTITFRADEIAQGLEVAQAALPIQAVRKGESVIVLSRKPSGAGPEGGKKEGGGGE